MIEEIEQQKIKKSKNELQEVFDCLNTPMFILDDDRKIIRANEALAKKLNKSFSDILGKKCYSLMHGTQSPPKGCPLEMANITGKALIEEKDGYIFEGDYATVIQKMPGKNRTKVRYLHTIEDISLTKDLIKQVIYSVEAERKVLGAEIHDDLLQAAFCAITHCNSVNQKINNEEAKARLELAIKSLDGLLQTGRKIIRELMPPMLETVGLIPAIKEHANNIFAGDPIVFNLTKANLTRLPNELEVTILRVVQEALMNVFKHSGASIVEVSLKLTNKKRFVKLTIEDNGKGLPVKIANEDGHIGIRLMRERVEMHRGCFCVESKPGNGTKIVASFPLNITETVTREFCYGTQSRSRAPGPSRQV